MARRKKKMTRDQTWFALFVVFALMISFGVSAIAASVSGRFNSALFIVLIFVLLAVFAAGYIVLSLPTVKGAIGEIRVNRALKSLSKRLGGEFIHNVIVRGEDGKTSQIDHVYVCRNGAFVIETKNYAGRIYGERNQKQ